MAAAIALAVGDERAASRVDSVGEEPALAERQWAEEIGMAIGWRGEVMEVPAERLPEHLRQPFDFRYELATDTTRIRTELAWDEPMSREEALRRTIQWERTQPGEPRQPQYAREDTLLAAQRNSHAATPGPTA